MSSHHPMDDAVLTHDPLGSRPEPEAERIEELSMTDDDTAMRLRAVEYDLVDAYAHGELVGPALERFRSSYIESPERNRKVLIASALLAREQPQTRSSWHWMAWAAAVLIGAAAIAYVAIAPRIRERQVPPVSIATHTASPVAPVTIVLPPPTRARPPRSSARSSPSPSRRASICDCSSNRTISRPTKVRSAISPPTRSSGGARASHRTGQPRSSRSMCHRSL